VVTLRKLPFFLINLSAAALCIIAIVMYASNTAGQVPVLFFCSILLVALSLFYYFAFSDFLIRILRVSPVLFIVSVWLMLCVTMAIPIFFMLDESGIRSFFISTNALTTTGIPLSTTWRFNAEGFLIWYDYCQWIGGYLTLISFWVLSYSRRYRSVEKRLNRRLDSRPREGIETSVIPMRLAVIYFAFSLTVALIFSTISTDFIIGIRSAFVLPATGSLFLHYTPDFNISKYAFQFFSSLVMLISISGMLWIMVITLSSNRKDNIREEQKLIGSIIISIFVIVFFMSFFKVDNEISFLNYFLKMISDIFLAISTGYVSFGDKDHLISIPLVIMLSLIGGISISTSGGIKLSRLLFLKKQILNDLLSMIYPNLALKKQSQEGYELQRMRRIWMIVTSLIILLILLICIYGLEGANFEYALLNATAIVSNSGGVLDYAGLLRGQSSDIEPFLVYSEFTILLSAILMIVARLEYVFVFSIVILIVRARRQAK